MVSIYYLNDFKSERLNDQRGFGKLWFTPDREVAQEVAVWHWIGDRQEVHVSDTYLINY